MAFKHDLIAISVFGDNFNLDRSACLAHCSCPQAGDLLVGLGLQAILHLADTCRYSFRLCNEAAHGRVGTLVFCEKLVEIHDPVKDGRAQAYDADSYRHNDGSPGSKSQLRLTTLNTEILQDNSEK